MQELKTESKLYLHTIYFTDNFHMIEFYKKKSNGIQCKKLKWKQNTHNFTPYIKFRFSTNHYFLIQASLLYIAFRGIRTTNKTNYFFADLEPSFFFRHLYKMFLTAFPLSCVVHNFSFPCFISPVFIYFKGKKYNRNKRLAIHFSLNEYFFCPFFILLLQCSFPV